MRSFYHPLVLAGEQVPSILGLSASPIMKSDPKQLSIVENNLNSISRTPLLHRQELMAHVRLPTLKCVLYGSEFTIEEEIQAQQQLRSPLGRAPILVAEPRLPRIVDSSRRVANRGPPPAPRTNQPTIARQTPLHPIIDLDLGPQFRVPGLGPQTEVRAVAPPLPLRSPPPLLESPRDKRRRAHPRPIIAAADDDAEFESIDPLTGETVVAVPVAPPVAAPVAAPVETGDSSSDEYEQIDPLTGEPIVAVPLPQTIGVPLPQTIDSDSSDCEQIDPMTGEPYISPLPKGATLRPAPFPEWVMRKTSKALVSLEIAYDKMDIDEDPWVVSQRARMSSGSARSRRWLANALQNKRTYSQDQMRALVNKAKHLYQECGAWAVDWFICEAVGKFMNRDKTIFDDNLDSLMDDDDEGIMESQRVLSNAEQNYLRKVLEQVIVPKSPGNVEGRITKKVEKLIEVLLEEYSAEHHGFSGLVFVEQRVAVAAVAQIISQHPRTRHIFKTGTMVGSSDGSFKRMKFLHDIIIGRQTNTLRDFRTGEKNLIIATSVIEEGLDVQDCHLVVCLDLPKNLKSFVQRRGRARREDSSYVLMFSHSDARIKQFQEAEQEMIRMYSDPDRELQKVNETKDEEELECEKYTMKVERTQYLPRTQSRP